MFRFTRITPRVVREKIKTERYKQWEVAKFMGISPDSFSKYLGGYKNMPDKYLEKLAEFLTTDTDIRDQYVRD